MIENNEAIGAVLDMGHEPHIYILEEYRRQGYGTYLLEKYIKKNRLTKGYQYVLYKPKNKLSEKLVKRFGEKPLYQVLKVKEKTYLILQDGRLENNY